MSRNENSEIWNFTGTDFAQNWNVQKPSNLQVFYLSVWPSSHAKENVQLLLDQKLQLLKVRDSIYF